MYIVRFLHFMPIIFALNGYLSKEFWLREFVKNEEILCWGEFTRLSYALEWNCICWLWLWILWAENYMSRYFETIITVLKWFRKSLEECLKRRIFLKRLISCQSFSIKHPWFDFIGQFSNYFVFDEIKWFVPLLNILH